MRDDNSTRSREVCVVIPTYNNERTVGAVIQGVLQECPDVFVINDGSTDRTKEILASFGNRIRVIEFEKNRGKGAALREGLKQSADSGFRYAITIDSDGQHLPTDIPIFLNALTEQPDSLLLGARNLKLEGAPAKSSFGNKFSNFWIWVMTGLRLPDSQTGFRCYPLIPMRRMRFFTRKFEFEVEVIVRSAWRGIPVKSVSVRAVYEQEHRVSHFRPFRDFMRISALNTILVTLSLLWFHPIRLARYIRGRGFWRVVKEDLYDIHESNFRKSASIGFGLFMGIVPVWGFQMLIAVALAIPLRLNKVIVLAFSNVSIPPMIPFIILGSYLAGAPFVSHPMDLSDLASITTHDVWYNFQQYLIGAVILAATTGIAGFLLSYILFRFFRPGK